MPRPTVAQLAYGSCTVIVSTLALLLLSQASSAPAIAVVTVAALTLGLLAAMIIPRRKPAPLAHRTATGARSGTEPASPEREQLAA
ncbi:hypothetical protein ABZ354_06485 [Streptomyces sp. NPDC005925]|uniref:hypothetical protein n=1 Tax=Streptomyces sp. NPDC005925 TaxID=3157172 RepID=UPI0033E93BCE